MWILYRLWLELGIVGRKQNCNKFPKPVVGCEVSAAVQTILAVGVCRTCLDKPHYCYYFTLSRGFIRILVILQVRWEFVLCLLVSLTHTVTLILHGKQEGGWCQ